MGTVGNEVKVGGRMETLEDIKTYIADMEKYCKIINSDATMPCKVAFTKVMRDVALRIADKCDKLEKEVENDDQGTKCKRTATSMEKVFEESK